LSEIRTMEISWQGSLYDPRSSDFVSVLEDAVESAEPESIFLLYAPTASHDYHKSWLDGLGSQFYWEDLVAHFQRLHFLLVKLCLSKSKWFFISSDDCLGSWWDLALACSGRIWANPYAKVGFPEIYIDLIPPLASGGLRRFEVYQTLDSARRHAILYAKDAYALGLVSLVLQGDGWATSEGLETLYPWILKSTMTSNLRSTTRLELISETPDVLGVIEDRGVMHTRRKQIASSHLETGYVALKERNLSARAMVMSSIRAGGAARVLFDDYRAWLSRRITRYELGAHDRWWTTADGLIVIDLSSGIPPQCLLEALIARKFHMVLMASSEELLRDALETVLSRFQRGGIPRKEIIESWKGKLDWIIGDRGSTTVTWMACNADDTVELGIGPEVFLARYRLSGNFGQTDLGWSEETLRVSPSAGISDDALRGVGEVADILANGVLRAQNWHHKISLSVALRFCFLREMLELAHTGAWPDVIEQCKLLAAAGWGFSSDVPRWDGLLRGYAGHEYLSAALSHLGFANDVPLKNVTMAELRSRTPIKSHISRFDVSAARLSRHFEAWAVEMSQRLVALNVVESVAMADLFVTLSWGYPGAVPVPSELGENIGAARLSYWLKNDRPETTDGEQP